MSESQTVYYVVEIDEGLLQSVHAYSTEDGAWEAARFIKRDWETKSGKEFEEHDGDGYSSKDGDVDVWAGPLD